MLFTTPAGWPMLAVDDLDRRRVRGLLLRISVFSIPMLLEERADALTAMGTSTALVWNNQPVMLTWGDPPRPLPVQPCDRSPGLIMVFPVIGHGTWHAYHATRPEMWEAS